MAAAPLEASLRFAAASLREGFIAPQLKLAVFPEHRLLRRRRAERARQSELGSSVQPRARCARSPTCARETSSCTRTTGWPASLALRRAPSLAITRDYLYLEYQGDDRVFVPTDQLAKISRYVGARR